MGNRKLSGKSNWEFGSVDSSYKTWQVYNKQVLLLEDASKVVYLSKREIDKTIFPLFYAILDTCDSITLLAHKGKVRDIFVLARSILETTINVCFVYAEGDAAAKRISKHAEQKAVRDLDREMRINTQKISLSWRDGDDLELPPRFSEAIEEYTTRRGKEIRQWTPENIVKRLEKIADVYGKRVGTSLAFGMFSIYRHASEISHGTLFGVMFALGVTAPNWDKRDLEKTHIGNLQMLLLVLGYVISALTLVVAKELSEPDLAKQTKSISRELADLFEAEFGKSNAT